MVQDSKEFGSAQQLGKGKNFPIHKQWLSGCVPRDPTTVTNKHRLGQMAELGLDLRTPPSNITAWESQQDLLGDREPKLPSQQHPGVTPRSKQL